MSLRGAFTDRDPGVAGGLPEGEVAHGPGQVVGGHPGRAAEPRGDGAVLLQHALLLRHVAQRRVLSVVPQRHGERGFVHRLVETRERFPGVDRTELGQRQESGEEEEEEEEG